MLSNYKNELSKMSEINIPSELFFWILYIFNAMKI